MGFMDQLETIPSQWRWMMIPLLIGVLGGGYWFLSYKPRAEAIAELEYRIDRQQQTLRKYQQIARSYNTFKAQVENLEVELRAALVKLPSGKEIPDLIRSISDLGVRTGLQITLLRPKAEKKHEFYAEVPITVQVEGQFHAVGEFFDRIGRLSRIVSISDITMDTKTKDKVSTLETQCLATTFRFLDPGEVEAVAAENKPKTKRKR
jgi:type IV pilus assembly protein PilO